MDTIPLNAVQWSLLLTAKKVTVKQIYAFGRTEGEKVFFRSGELTAEATVASVEYGQTKNSSNIIISDFKLETN